MKSDSGLSAYIKCSNTLGAVHFMTTDRQEINVHLIYVNGDFSNTLSSVSMEKYFILAANLTDLLQRLNCANFIVHMDN